ncbi:hypothetical protein BDV95DRAFT_148923 [Massariosphaeria phaeospora]|uniref:Uncharacterized protein n=1 Tax=Massariosphaeria phaeospora TaxID=100035 RepID=A0A7C8MXL3_9PLEO|nr:hypothetical protein BDV95DRAFT_148923 [Massariosphaeria phaeospora]
MGTAPLLPCLSICRQHKLLFRASIGLFRAGNQRNPGVRDPDRAGTASCPSIRSSKDPYKFVESFYESIARLHIGWNDMKIRWPSVYREYDDSLLRSDTYVAAILSRTTQTSWRQALSLDHAVMVYVRVHCAVPGELGTQKQNLGDAMNTRSDESRKCGMRVQGYGIRDPSTQWPD